MADKLFHKGGGHNRAMTSKGVELLRLLRPHQWAKNLLAFVALFASHRFADPAALAASVQVFVALCLAASAVYVFNDAIDVAADRAHPHKRTRPFASGALSPRHAGWLIPVLLAGAVVAAYGLPHYALLGLLTYVALAAAYCLGLKRTLWLDVLVLAALYTLRILAGAFAIAVEPSPWLLAFAVFVFFSLAALKRYVDLRESDGDLPGRAYRAGDAPAVLGFGVAAAVAAVLVLALYLNSEQVRTLYAAPAWLWPACPALLYWLARVWTLAHRRELHADPVLFALRDPASLVLAVFLLALGALAL